MVACMVVLAPHVEAITCGDVVINVLPCIEYLRSRGALSSTCCDGVKRINSVAKSSADRKLACECLKSVYSKVSGINTATAADLPRRCGTSAPYFSPTTDHCSTVLYLEDETNEQRIKGDILAIKDERRIQISSLIFNFDR
ncbi:hypothetical protein L2E82_11212 [Cichorium intybus]|uniref:Uncharacterized protein n=1 Tax=Cichorium intybus TaxID=13427 RepID=A0ACB9GDT4_CICIN|nr:hypothetical protein L2E82_11212 [Cichorium intybus]